MNMIKLKFLAVFLLGIASLAQSQSPLIDKKGVATFFSEAPLEDIEAKNEAVLGALNLEKGLVAVSMKMTDFRFDNSLMEEHFNENYIESEKYPKATFTGKIADPSTLDFESSGQFSTKVKGLLEIHGVSKPIEADVSFDISGDVISVKTSFDIAVADHKIKIPKLVIKNIAEVVAVNASFKFAKP